MATDYNSPAPGQYTESTTTSTSTSEGIGLDRSYVRTLPSILKIAEMVLDLVAFICASANIWWANSGGGWVQFVTISALITTLLFFLFHLFRIFTKLPGPWILIEFVYYVIYTGLLLIAAIVAAAKTSLHTPDGNSAIIAAALFTFACVAVYAVDTFFMFKRWRSSRFPSGGSSTTATTTTSTTTTYEQRTQY